LDVIWRELMAEAIRCRRTIARAVEGFTGVFSKSHATGFHRPKFKGDDPMGALY
jgi:hypothetical protein